jgi:hypothetical protein
MLFYKFLIYLNFSMFIGVHLWLLFLILIRIASKLALIDRVC